MTVSTPGFFLVIDHTATELVDAFRDACAARDIPFYPLEVDDVRAWEVGPLPAESLLYIAATTTRGVRLGERLWSPEVVSLYNNPLGPLAPVVEQATAFALARVPIPRSVLVLNRRPDALRASVDAVGGFPCVVRFVGGSGGAGIVLAESMAALRSLLDLEPGAVPELVTYVRDATMWRVAVVGDRAIGATRGVIPEGDFRSIASDDHGDYLSRVPRRLGEVAVAATRAVEVEAAGVDVLERGDELYVLEANTPFYFGHLQRHGIDVAGALLSHLLVRLVTSS